MSGIIFLILRILLAVALYLFLGLSLYLLWRDMKEQHEILAIHKEPSISFLVQEGDASKAYRYKTNEIIIGRDPSCGCTLISEKVSANHARLSFHENHWWIEDLKSTNGSFLNNERILVPTVVVEGDLLRFGDVTVTISILGLDPA